MIQGLPASAPLWREENSWTVADELAAKTVETLDGWLRLIFTQLGGKPRGQPLKVPRPQHIEEAAEPKTNRRKITSLSQMGELAKWFKSNG